MAKVILLICCIDSTDNSFFFSFLIVLLGFVNVLRLCMLMCQFDCYDLSAYRKKPFASLTYLYNYFWYLYYSNYLQGKNKGALGANYNTYQLSCFSSCFAPKSHGLGTTFDKKVDLGWKPVTCIFYAKSRHWEIFTHWSFLAPDSHQNYLNWEPLWERVELS